MPLYATHVSHFVNPPIFSALNKAKIVLKLQHKTISGVKLLYHNIIQYKFLCQSPPWHVLKHCIIQKLPIKKVWRH